MYFIFVFLVHASICVVYKWCMQIKLSLIHNSKSVPCSLFYLWSTKLTEACNSRSCCALKAYPFRRGLCKFKFMFSSLRWKIMAIVVNEINRTLWHLLVSFKSMWNLLALPDCLSKVSYKVTVISRKIYHDNFAQKISKLYNTTSYTCIWFSWVFFFLLVC